MHATIKIRHTDELADFIASMSLQTLGLGTEISVKKVGEFWEVEFSR